MRRLSSWRLARRAGRNGDSRARLSDPPRGAPGMPLCVACGGCCSQPSGRSAEVLGEHLGGCPPRECLARPTVQRRRDGCELLGTVAGEGGGSWGILAQQPLGVLVRAALPRASWITEIDLQTAVEP